MRGLGAKLVVLLLLAGALPLLVSGAIAIVVARESSVTAVREGNRQVARRAAREIAGVLEGDRQLLRAAADNRVHAGLSADDESRMLASFKLQFHALESLTRFAPDGRAVAWSEAVAPLPIASDDPGLLAALRDEPHASAVTTGEDLVPRMRVTLPVHRLGRPVGALMANLDLVAMWRIVDDIQVGASGRVVLLDADGALIAHGDRGGKALVVTRTRLPELAAAARAAADQGALFEGTGSLGRPTLSVAVPVAATPWVLVLEQDASEAFASARRLSWFLGGLIVAAVLVAAVGGLRLARRRVIHPVRVLERAAAEFGQKHFDHRVELRTGDELESLARAMNEMAASLADARDELGRHERARALAMIAGGILHDLKHPVATFQSLFLRADLYTADELDRRLAEAARRETPRLEALMERLRDVGRAGARRDSEFDAAGLAAVAEAFRDRGVTVTVEAPPPGLRLRADKQMLARAIENLLSNAIDASPAGATVRVTIEGREDDLEVRVEDQGGGVAGSVRDKLFRGFASTKEGGLGLGLTVVRQVAEAHGGSVTMEQPASGGSRFVLRVPLMPPVPS